MLTPAHHHICKSICKHTLCSDQLKTVNVILPDLWQSTNLTPAPCHRTLAPFSRNRQGAASNFHLSTLITLLRSLTFGNFNKIASFFYHSPFFSIFLRPGPSPAVPGARPLLISSTFDGQNSTIQPTTWFTFHFIGPGSLQHLSLCLISNRECSLPRSEKHYSMHLAFNLSCMRLSPKKKWNAYCSNWMNHCLQRGNHLRPNPTAIAGNE